MILWKGLEQCPIIKNIVSKVKYMQIYTKSDGDNRQFCHLMPQLTANKRKAIFNVQSFGDLSVRECMVQNVAHFSSASEGPRNIEI